MSTSTDIEVVTTPTVTLFQGATPRDLITAAGEVADAFSDIVRRQRLFQRIAGREHVLIEGWQTVGTLVGVFAVRDKGVVQLPWPAIDPPGEQPQDPGREPRRDSTAWPEWDQARTALARWQHHRDLLAAKAEGLAFGFTASYNAEQNGRVIGWGEGRCSRSESKWTLRDDYAIESMAQTRGQSRTLAAPLRFIVKLAGYATTPAEEAEPGGDGGDFTRISELEQQLAEAQALLSLTQERAGAVLDLKGQQEVTEELETVWPTVDVVRFLAKLEKRFGGYVPEAAGDTLRAWAWFVGRGVDQTGESPENGSQSVSDGDSTEPTTGSDES